MFVLVVKFLKIKLLQFLKVFDPSPLSQGTPIYCISEVYKTRQHITKIIEDVAYNLQLLKVRFTTIFSRFFAKILYFFHKIEVQTVILRCWMGLNLNCFKSYDTKRRCFRGFSFLRIFSFVITFEPIHYSAPQNDPLILSFVEDI